MIIDSDWATVKSIIDDGGRPSHIKYNPASPIAYRVYVQGGSMIHCCELIEGDADYTTFTTSYLGNSNKPTESDRDGAQWARTKVADAGSSYLASGVRIETSTIGSLENIDCEGNDVGDATLKFYDDQDAELTTQGDCDTDCVKTVLDMEPDHEVQVIGGFLSATADVTQKCEIHVIQAPDITPGNGGSVYLVRNIDIQYLEGGRHDIDGRSTRRIPYNATTHEGKMRFVFNHGAGVQIKLQFVREYFR